MIDNNDALLAYLTPRFTNRTEDVAVEALGYILSRSTAAAGALTETLRAGGADIGDISRVQTQVSDEQGARPDLVGFDDRGAERVLVEAKFWAGLTDNQPSSYLERVRKVDQPSVLLFVAPEARVEMLWVELRRRASTVDAFPLCDEENKANLKSASDGEGTYLMLMSWRTLLDGMSSRARLDGDARIGPDIRQLQALCERMDTDAFLPLRPDELAPGFPRRMLNLRQLIDEATVRARDGGFVDTDGLQVTSRADGYGRYIRIGVQRRAGAWFGISFTLWANHRETPPWVKFSEFGTVRSEEVRRSTGMMIGDSPDIPVHLPLGVEHDAVLDSVVERLRAIAGLIE